MPGGMTGKVRRFTRRWIEDLGRGLHGLLHCWSGNVEIRCLETTTSSDDHIN